jgi:hypothetical protein
VRSLLAHLSSPVAVGLERNELLVLSLELGIEFLAYRFYLIQSFRVLGRLKDLVKLLLECCRLGQGPVGFFLVAKNDIVEDGPGDAEQARNLVVEIRAAGTECATLVERVSRAYHKDFGECGGGKGGMTRQQKKGWGTTLVLSACSSANASVPSRVFIVRPSVFLLVTWSLRPATILALFVLKKRSFTSALTSFSQAI